MIAYNGKQPGDPLKGVKAIVDIVRAEDQAAGKEFPRQVVLGTDCYNEAKGQTEKIVARLEEWKGISFSTDF
jgi:hypothetical protein